MSDLRMWNSSNLSISFSKSLIMIFVREMGRSWLQFVKGDSLGMGVTLASFQWQSNASSLCCKASFRCSLTTLKDTYLLSGLAGWLAETMTERWSDRTRLLNTTGVFHRCELLVRNTSKILSSRVDLVTNCFKLCWEIQSLMLRWLMSPAIMMRAFGSLAKMSSQVSNYKPCRHGFQQKLRFLKRILVSIRHGL